MDQPPPPVQEPKSGSPINERSVDEFPKTPYNLNAITVYATNNMFLIDPVQAAPMQTRLLIDRRNGRLSELDFSAPFQHQIEFKKTYSAFIGIANILERPFLVLVDEAQQVCFLGRHRIYAISSVSFIPFENSADFFNTEKGNELINLIANIRKVLSQGFYFSYTYDLTLAKTKKINSTGSDPKFMWNYYMYRDLILCNISPKWQLPIIQGYIGHFTIPIKNKPLRYYIVSRRSCQRPGTRLHTKGLDDDGHVANFVETEQIAYYNGYCCSHAQLRGNPPVFFTGSPAKVTRNVDLTTNAFVKHMQSLEADWGYVLAINLLTTTKKEEQAITDVFETLMRKNMVHKTRYEFLDYLNATKGQKFEKVNIVIQKLKPLLENMNFYAEDELTETVKLTQKGILRINCIDGLERSNALQTKIAIALFDLQMRQIGVDLTSEFTQDPLYQLDNDNLKQQHPLLVAFRDLWNENGDCISMLYAGVMSTAVANAKNANKGFFGFLDAGIKSIATFNLAPIEENVKQDGINLILGQHTETTNAIEKVIETALKVREKEFAKYEEISVFITTWNVGNYVPPATFNFTALFDFENKPAPDVIAVGLQEHIELSASNVVVGNDESIDFVWQELLLKTLRKTDKYIVVHKEILVGILLIIFVKDHLRDRINHLDVDVVKTGLAGTLGNKGAVVMKFNIDDSSLCFINCHMEAGNKQNSVRLMNLLDFHQKAFQQGGPHRKAEEKIINLDYKFLFGDTNFRLNCSYVDARAMIDKYQSIVHTNKEEAQDALQWLLDEDQLAQSRGASELLDGYREGKIAFLPTYKYDVNTDNYDTSKKQRTPSWTDRIMWRCDSGEVKQHFYGRREFQCSDHRPVVSYFTIRVKKVDKALKQAIVRELYQSAVQAQVAQSIQNLGASPSAQQSALNAQNAQNAQNIKSMAQSQTSQQTQDTNQSEQKSPPTSESP